MIISIFNRDYSGISVTKAYVFSLDKPDRVLIARSSEWSIMVSVFTGFLERCFNRRLITSRPCHVRRTVPDVGERLSTMFDTLCQI